MSELPPHLIQDLNRELIQNYEDCQWRATRFEIIRDLGQHASQRGLEFLFQLILQSDQDLPIAEAAIIALGQTGRRLAARFLVTLFHEGPESLKPTIVGALTDLGDRTLALEFLQALPQAAQAQKTLLARNLALALGELKIPAAVVPLAQIARRETNPQLRLAALISLGKTARSTIALEPIQTLFQDDLLDRQIFASVKSQIQFRTHWKLDDYLTKLFQSPQIHRALPFELNHFPSNEVKAGLQKYTDAIYLDRLAYTLSKLDFPEVVSWYAELIDLNALDELTTGTVLDSLGAHYTEQTQPLLDLLQSKNPRKWAETVALSLPNAEAVFRNYVTHANYRALSAEDRIQVINEMIDFGLSTLPQRSRLQAIGQLLEEMLHRETQATIQARLLRGCGRLHQTSSKLTAFLKEKIADPEILPAILSYLTLFPQKNGGALLLELTRAPTKKENDTKRGNAILKAIAAQTEIPNLKELEPFVRATLVKEHTQLESLRLIGKHAPSFQKLTSQNELIEQIHAQLVHEPVSHAILIAGLIALKGLQSETSAEAVAPFLLHPEKAVSGRALDTLTALPGLRAKRLTMEHLKENADNLEICDKIIRSFTPPEVSNPYFSQAIDEVIQTLPDHPLMDGLVELKSKLALHARQSAVGALLTGANVAALDQELAKNIHSYDQLEETVRYSLRAAELPFLHPEIFDENVDKSSSVLQYCKAVDLLLEKEIGRRILFPKLENNLHEFQNVLHATSLNEPFPSGERVLQNLGLQKHFSAQSLPVHKMSLIAQGILTGRILNDHFKILDGLRAWAVVLLVFARKTGTKPLINLKNASDDHIAHLCKQLIALQEVRNPAAHRQTYVKFVDVDQVRSGVHALVNAFQKIFTQ